MLKEHRNEIRNKIDKSCRQLPGNIKTAMFKLDDEKKQPKVLDDIRDEIEVGQDFGASWRSDGASRKMFPHGRAIIYN